MNSAETLHHMIFAVELIDREPADSREEIEKQIIKDRKDEIIERLWKMIEALHYDS